MPSTLEYRFVVSAPPRNGRVVHLDVFDGAELLLDGVPVGAPLTSNVQYLETVFDQPSTIRPSGMSGRLAIRVATPCGRVDVTVPALNLPPNADSDEFVIAGSAGAPGRAGIRLSTEMSVPEGIPVIVYADSGGGDVHIGELALSSPGPALVNFLAGCGAEAVPVSVNGEQIGMFRPATEASPTPQVLFVSADSESCHQLTQLVYSATGPGERAARFSRGAGLHRLRAAPDFYMQPAPESFRSTERNAYRSELVRVDCSDVPEFPTTF